jgi:DNA-binding response OmpR family regulator
MYSIMSQAPTPTHTQKIMLADDDLGIVDSLSLILQEFNYTVEVTTDGEKLKGDLTDVGLILLDLRMSGIDGKDLCLKLKKDPRTRTIPIIIVSANRDTEAIAAECGADDFLLKPFEMDELLGKVKRYIKH